MADFFRLFVKQQLVEAAQLLSRESSCTVWALSPKLHDPSIRTYSTFSRFLVCGAPDARAAAAVSASSVIAGLAGEVVSLPLQ